MISIYNVSTQDDHKLFHTYLDQVEGLSLEEEGSPNVLLDKPGWIFFETDFNRKKAVFLHIGEAPGIIEAPFFYTAAPRIARRAAVVELDTFLALSENIKTEFRMVHLYNMGHCGSTLLHNVVNEGGEAWDISEPKFSFATAMGRNALPRPQLVSLAAASLRFMSLYPRASERKTLFLKHHSQCSQALDLWHEASPSAKSLYMYRDAVGWCNSLYGFVQRVGLTMPMSKDARRFSWMMTSGGEPESLVREFMDFDMEPFRAEEMFACGWALHIQNAMRTINSGADIPSLRYNELIQDREKALTTVFRHCGLDPAKVALGLAAFDHDSHAGEKTAHDKPVQRLGNDAVRRITEILTHPRFAILPEVILPRVGELQAVPRA